MVVFDSPGFSDPSRLIWVRFTARNRSVTRSDRAENGCSIDGTSLWALSVGNWPSKSGTTLQKRETDRLSSSSYNSGSLSYTGDKEISVWSQSDLTPHGWQQWLRYFSSINQCHRTKPNQFIPLASIDGNANRLTTIPFEWSQQAALLHSKQGCHTHHQAAPQLGICHFLTSPPNSISTLQGWQPGGSVLAFVCFVFFLFCLLHWRGF